MPKYKKYQWKDKAESETSKCDLKVRTKVVKKRRKKLQKSQEIEKKGRRIVELSVLGQQLWCVSCKEALSLDYIETEHRRGLGSILLVKCHKCSVVNTCCTDKKHESATDDRNIRFDINYKAAMGTLHTGIGWTHFNKLLACMNIPTVDFKTYKRYKEQVENMQNNKKEETSPTSADSDDNEKSIDLQ